MRDLLLKKIDHFLEKTGDTLLHILPTESGRYFDPCQGGYVLDHILSRNQSFFTGMAIQAYYATKDKKYLDWCMQFADAYYHKVVNRNYDTSQDVGMLYLLYAVPLYKLTGDERLREMALRAADELARRFIPNGGYLKAWGRADGHYPPYVDDYSDDDPFFNENKGLMTIETMMNLPLLLWATRESNQPYYERIAASHIQQTAKYLIRKDFSVSHGYRFNESSGEPYCEDNYYGYKVGSYWAKGAAMAIYGYALCSRYARYAPKADFGMALRLLDRFIDRCGGELPAWDFDCHQKNVDTQAAAIVLCAVKEIKKVTTSPKIDAFENMLASKLADFLEKNDGIDGILRGQNGRNEYDVAGDYFITEAFLGNRADIWF